MEEVRKKKQGIELRSERGRSIVGQIPPTLAYYGVAIIGGMLLCFFAVVHHLPYRQVYSGVAIIQGEKRERQADSVEVFLLLRFEGKQLTGVKELPLSLFDEGKKIAQGKLLQISSQRDTLERQRAICLLSLEDWEQVNHHAVDFQIAFSSGTLLTHMLGIWQITP